MAKQVPLVLFSGGLDSSYLLQEALRAGDVETLYVVGVQSELKVSQELRARQAIIDILERETGHRVRADHHITIAHSGVTVRRHEQEASASYNNNIQRFPQAGDWIYGALQIVNPQYHSVLRVGYVCGDTIISHLRDLEESYRAMQAATHFKYTPVEFPLVYTRKPQIIRALHRHVYRNVWYCEHPTARSACGNCTPCQTMAQAKQSFEILFKMSVEEFHRQSQKE